MIFYADLIFLFNFIIDAILLLTTAWIRQIHVSKWRIVASSLVGASYVVMMFFPPLSFMFTFLVKCLFSFLMIWIAFGFGGLQNFLRNIGVFYVACFVAAGGIFGFYYFFQSSSDVMNGIYFTQTGVHYRFQVGFLFISCMVIVLLWLYRIVFVSVKRRVEMTGFIAEVHIYIEDCHKVCTGLIDTGNQLYDPLTRTPVMVVEVSQWSDLLPPEWLAKIKNFEVDQILSAIGTEQFRWQDRLRLVPYRGVNRGTQFMLALKPDKVVIMHNERQLEVSKVLIALDSGKLCSDGSYQAIIHPALMTV